MHKASFKTLQTNYFSKGPKRLVSIFAERIDNLYQWPVLRFLSLTIARKGVT